MYIAIKSEIDSRVLLYPLMRVLKNYGSICVISSNRQLRRLIDDELEGGFRNIRVIVEESGATDDVYELYGIAPGDFDFVILDNVGILDYDKCLIPLGAKHSEGFDDDVAMMLEFETEKTHVIQFGKAPKKVAGTKETTRGKQKEEKKEYDPAEKFRFSEEELKKKKAQDRTVTVPFPNYQQIEDMEAEHRFYDVDHTLANAFYDIFNDVLAVEKNQFQKEVRKKDESSGYIKSRNRARED